MLCRGAVLLLPTIFEPERAQQDCSPTATIAPVAPPGSLYGSLLIRRVFQTVSPVENQGQAVGADADLDFAGGRAGWVHPGGHGAGLVALVGALAGAFD